MYKASREGYAALYTAPARPSTVRYAGGLPGAGDGSERAYVCPQLLRHERPRDAQTLLNGQECSHRTDVWILSVTNFQLSRNKNYVDILKNL